MKVKFSGLSWWRSRISFIVLQKWIDTGRFGCKWRVRNKVSAAFTILVISWQMIGLYFRTIPDANLLDTVCISMRACIFPAGSHKGVVFASLWVSISDSLSFSFFLYFFFIFKIRGAKRRGIIAQGLPRRNHPLARQDVSMAENVRRIAATTELMRELARINALRIRFFAYCQTCRYTFPSQRRWR